MLHAVRRELAQRVEDVLVRRTHLYYERPDRGVRRRGRVAELMGGELGWDTARSSAAGDGREYLAVRRAVTRRTAMRYLSLRSPFTSRPASAPGDSPVDPNVFETANAGFAQAMYEEFLEGPSAVDPDWRRLFESGVVGERPKPAVRRRRPAERRRHRRRSGAAAPTPTARPCPAGATPIKGPAAKLVANMDESLTVPTATTFRVVAVGVARGAAPAPQPGAQGGGRPGKISFTHLIAYALVQATKQHPVMGHTLAIARRRARIRVVPEGIALGLAVDVQRKDGSRGLVVPVIKRADTMDFAAFHAAYEALVDKARTNRLLPDDFAGATMSLTNPGGLGTVASVPRLMAGQGSIIAVGAIGYPAEFAGVSEERLREFGISKVMTITSTYDHRVIQGAESGAFLATVDHLLQGDAGILRSARGEPAAFRGELSDRQGHTGGHARGGTGAGRAGDAVPRGGGDGAGQSLPHARPPRGAPRSARHTAHRRSRAQSRPARSHARSDGRDPVEGAAHRRARGARSPSPCRISRPPIAAPWPTRSSTSRPTKSACGSGKRSSQAPIASR